MGVQPAFLYIEDHPASRQVFRLIMTNILEYDDITLLDHTTEILAQLEAIGKQYDVIFLDLNMEPTDGYQVCQVLRQHDAYARARIIGLTANVTPAIIRKMQDHGFDGVVGKPISHDTFALQLDEILLGKPLWEA